MADEDGSKDPVTTDIADAIVVPNEAEQEPQHTPVIVQRRNGVPALLGGVLAAVIGFGVAQVVPNGWPLQSTDVIAADIAAMKTEIGGLREQNTALQQQLAAASAPDSILTERVAALESAPTDTKTLTDRLTALESQPASLGPDTGGGINVATSVLSAQAKAIADLQADVAALKSGGGVSAEIEARLAEAEVRATALSAQTEADATAARLRTALDRLSIALETGAPFGTILADLGDASIPAVLMENGDGGLPSLTTLQTSFPEAARAALDASLRVSAGESWTDRAASFLRSQTGARSLTPRAGTDPDAVLSRVEAALADGRVAEAMTETAGLPPEGQAELAAWVEQGNLFLAGQQAVEDLRTALKVE